MTRGCQQCTEGGSRQIDEEDVLRCNSSSDTEVGKVRVRCSTKHMRSFVRQFDALSEGKPWDEKEDIHASIKIEKASIRSVPHKADAEEKLGQRGVSTVRLR